MAVLGSRVCNFAEPFAEPADSSGAPRTYAGGSEALSRRLEPLRPRGESAAVQARCEGRCEDGSRGAFGQHARRNLSETVFLLPAEDGDARICIFAPAAELAFAGHPVLG